MRKDFPLFHSNQMQNCHALLDKKPRSPILYRTNALNFQKMCKTNLYSLKRKLQFEFLYRLMTGGASITPAKNSVSQENVNIQVLIQRDITQMMLRLYNFLKNKCLGFQEPTKNPEFALRRGMLRGTEVSFMVCLES